MQVTEAHLTRQDIVHAFRFLLGREPESDATIDAHLGLGSVAALRRAIMASAEFRAGAMQAQHAQSKWVSAEVLGGYTMWLDLHDRYVSHGCLGNDWEPEETAFVRSALHSGATVLDIGANIGWFSLVAARAIGAHGQIHAFEPRPDIARWLHRTIGDNRLQQVVNLWPYALDDQPSELTMSWQAGTDNPGGSHIDPLAAGGAASGRETVRVQGVLLDDLLPGIAPDFVKIDVEGAEPRALAGARQALSRKRPTVLSELYPRQLESVSGSSSRAYIAMMESMGYRCYLLENGRPGRRLGDFPGELNRELVSVVFTRVLGG
jgi:FkbM family methyltransferase